LSSPRIIKPELSIAFDHLLTRMMAKDRDKRYDSWEQLIEDLRVLLDAPDPAALKLPPLPDPLPLGGINAEDDPPETLVVQLRKQSTAGSGAEIELKPREREPAPLSPPETAGEEGVPGLKPLERPDTEVPLPSPPSAAPPDAEPEGQDEESAPVSAVPPPKDRSINKAVAFAVVAFTLLGVAAGGVYLWIAAQDAEGDRVAGHQQQQVDEDRDTVVAVEGAIAYQQTRAEIAAKAEEQERRVGEMLSEAAASEKKNPLDVAAAIAKYQAIEKHAAGTRYELEVRDHLTRLEKQLANAPDLLVAELRREGDELARAWRFHEAARVANGYDGALAAVTTDARRELAASYLATARTVDALYAAMRPGVQGLAKVRLAPLRDAVVTLEGQPRWQQEAMAVDAAAGMRELLVVGNQFFESFSQSAGRELTLTIDGREGRWRIRGAGDLGLRADLDGRTRTLTMASFSAREILGRVQKDDSVGYALLRAVLAARADRPDVATNTLAGLPDGILPRMLAGELLLHRATGNWEGDGATRLSLRSDGMTLSLSGRRIVGPTGILANELLLMGSNGQISNRYPVDLSEDGKVLDMRLASGEKLRFRRSN
jgi:hypothetical protein